MPFTYEPEYDYTRTRSSRIRIPLDIEEKGITLGGMNERFDPNAIDGDGDGIVQEGTAFERPATPGADAVDRVLGMASTGSARTTGDTTGRRMSRTPSTHDDAPPHGIPRPKIDLVEVDEHGNPVNQKPMDKVRTALSSMFRRRPEKSRRYRNVYGHPQRYEGMSAKEIAEHIVPSSAEDHARLSAEYYIGPKDLFLSSFPQFSEKDYIEFRDKVIKVFRERIEDDATRGADVRRQYLMGQITDEEYVKMLEDDCRLVAHDYSPETVKRTRKMVEDALDESESFRWMVDRFGMPPILSHYQDTLKDGTPVKYKFAGFYDNYNHNITLSPATHEMIGEKPGKLKAGQYSTGSSTGRIIRHEYGHFLVDILDKRSDYIYADRTDITPAELANSAYMREEAIRIGEALSPPDATSMAEAVNHADYFVDTQYAQNSFAETWAEAIAAYTEPNGEGAHMISPELIKTIEAAIGANGTTSPLSRERDKAIKQRTVAVPSRLRDSSIRKSEINKKEPSIMDFDRPIKHEVGKTRDGNPIHKFTIGDHVFTWEPEEDPEDEAKAVSDAVANHFVTEVFGGAVKAEGDQWFDRQISNLLFGYAVEDPNFRHYARYGKWDKESFPEFDAVLTGEVSGLDELQQFSVEEAMVRSFRVMQGVADSEVSTDDIYRVGNDPGDSVAIGDVVPFPLTHFAPGHASLGKMAWNTDHVVSDGQLSSGGAIIKITGPHYSVTNGEEMVTQGNFRIKSIYTDSRGNKVVEMEQVDVFSPKDNAFKTVPTDGQIAMRELGSKYPINVSVKPK